MTGKLTEKVDARIEPELYAQLEKRAEQEERSIGAIIRRAIRAYLK